MRQILLVLSFAISQLAKGQNITAYRYWFDNDISNGQLVNGVFGQDALVSQLVESNSISSGFHSINLMFQQDNGLWSSVISHSFYRFSSNGVAGYEYWFDTLYSKKKAVLKPVSTNLVITGDMLETTGLSNGFHYLNIRFKPDGGLWSSIQDELIFKRGEDIYPGIDVTSLQYWFDDKNTALFERKFRNLPNNTLQSNLDISFLAIGRHKVSYQFSDNGKLISSNLADSITKIPIRNYNLLKPKITLGASILLTPQDFRITGKDFYPLSKIYLYAGDSKNILVDTFTRSDINGNIDIYCQTNNNMESGQVSVIALDSATENLSNVQRFNLVNSAGTYIPTINMVSPVRLQTQTANVFFPVLFNELIEMKALYPQNFNQGKRRYKYILSTSVDSFNWQPVKVIEGYAPLGAILPNTENILIPNAGNYFIQIKDAYHVQNNVAAKIVIEPNSVVDFDAVFAWDYSFSNTGNPQPQGVCADGTARIYLNILKNPLTVNPNTIIKTKVELIPVLTAEYNLTTKEVLGKLKPVSNCAEVYITEANDADALSSEISAPNCGSFFKYWYVAPDDFNQDFEALKNSGYRVVKMKVTVTWSNNVIQEKILEIKVIRPPLLLAHGLGSGPETWDNFRYNRSPSDDNPFIKSGAFLFPSAITLNPSASFYNNARLLIGKDFGGASNQNSLVGIVDRVRKKGWACNRVDYVGHSMGGVVLRVAATDLATYFYGQEPGYNFRNYGRGFVNKFITIGTPHNSSPIADITFKVVGNLNFLARAMIAASQNWDKTNITKYFIEPKPGEELELTHKVTDAVRDLQVLDINGGINLSAFTGVRTHLIASKIGYKESELHNAIANFSLGSLLAVINMFTNDCLTAEIAGYIEKLKYITDVALINQYRSYIERLKVISTLSTTIKTYEYIKFLLDINNYENIFINSDLIVPLSSQLAGLPENSTNVSVFGGLNAVNHMAETASLPIGNRVFLLLNEAIGSNMFGEALSATPNKFSNSQLNTTTDRFLNDSTIRIIRDTQKFRILPVIGNIGDCRQFAMDSTYRLSVVNQLPDSIIFQGFSYMNNVLYTAAKSDTVTFQFQLENTYQKEGVLYARALMDSSSHLTEYYDSIKICQIQPLLTTSLSVNPAKYHVEIGFKVRPDILIVSDSSVKQSSISSSDLSISIQDTAIVGLTDDYMFLAKQFGTTPVIFGYNGFYDTVYIYVRDTLDIFQTLPVLLKEFYIAVLSCDRVMLRWKTMNEQNNSGFEIQKSDDAINFKTIGFVPGIQSPGLDNDYQFNIQNLPDGKYYFRFKQVDLDGNYSFSPVRSYITDCSNLIRLQPNPVKDIIELTGLDLSRNRTARIIDSRGAIVKTIQTLVSPSINVSDLASGWYMLVIDDLKLKFVKQ